MYLGFCGAERLLRERARIDVLNTAHPLLLLLVRHRLVFYPHISGQYALLSQLGVRGSCNQNFLRPWGRTAYNLYSDCMMCYKPEHVRVRIRVLNSKFTCRFYCHLHT